MLLEILVKSLKTIFEGVSFLIKLKLAGLETTIGILYNGCSGTLSLGEVKINA